MLHASFQKQLPLIVELFKQHKIKNAYAFGSVVTDRFNEKSDVDFIINFMDGLDPLERGELKWNLRFALEDTLHRNIDLLSENTLSNPYLIQSINSNKQLIYEC